MTDVSLEEEGTVSVKASAKTKYLHSEEDELETRELCANIANFLVSELDRTYVRFQTQQAMHNRIFIGEKYKEVESTLENIEERFREFQEKYGIISLPDQVSAAISAVAEIQGLITMAEIELELLKNALSRDHAMVREKEIELEQLRKRSIELTNGGGDEEPYAVFLSFSETPDLSMEFIRLQRELEVQSLIFKFITEQYEQAKIQEAKDTPTTQIIDKARPPIKRSKPKRKLLVVFAGIASIFLSLLWVFSMERVEELRARDRKQYEKLVYIASIVPFLRGKRRDLGDS